jgi:phosphoribosylpyrophosphate synthetase
MSDSNEVILLPGSSTTALAKRVAEELNIRLGRVDVSR